ncbi:MAG: hydratase [Treponema sp.]|jgi:aconitate hydratase|nr:hydratase [Treponema sp.]
MSSVSIIDRPVFLCHGKDVLDEQEAAGLDIEAARNGTIAAGILGAHQTGPLANDENLHLTFDALASHDITYVGIIQTARVSGLKAFPVPYVLTCCHNSLCAVGGTINGDDHLFGLSAARKYGGIFVPPNLAVIHSYMRETFAGCGKMILGSDSHTRYGALGCLAVGEGGGELVKQLLGQSYDMARPRVIAVYLEGEKAPWIGPMDLALTLIGAVYKSGFVKNAVLEFVGPGIAPLSADFRNGVDVMTTETACWSSVWRTDETTRGFLALHGREADYRELSPGETACYDGMVKIDLSKVTPMIALPFHPSNVFALDEVIRNPKDHFEQIQKNADESLDTPVDLGLLSKVDADGVHVDQAVIAGCAGGSFENIVAAAAVVERGDRMANLSVYPGSQPVYLELAKNGILAKLVEKGVVVKPAFCGPCFGSADIPPNKGLSIRHVTRNFPNREGSKPAQGQIAQVAIMDARSIAATSVKGGILSAAHLDFPEPDMPYHYDDTPYRMRVYNGLGNPLQKSELIYGPNIGDWPPMEALGKKILVKIIAYITDDVTTTDELIPSGETSSYRSNPHALSEFTLSRKDPSYVGKAKAVRNASAALLAGDVKTALAFLSELGAVLNAAGAPADSPDIQLGSAIFARKPGDGSAREQAASCQRVLGGLANFANEYATKRYRSNLINWGIIPFIVEGETCFKNGDYIYVKNAWELIDGASQEALVINGGGKLQSRFMLKAPVLDETEKQLLRAGCLINANRLSSAGGDA